MAFQELRYTGFTENIPTLNVSSERALLDLTQNAEGRSIYGAVRSDRFYCEGFESNGFIEFGKPADPNEGFSPTFRVKDGQMIISRSPVLICGDNNLGCPVEFNYEASANFLNGGYATFEMGSRIEFFSGSRINLNSDSPGGSAGVIYNTNEGVAIENAHIEFGSGSILSFGSGASLSVSSGVGLNFDLDLGNRIKCLNGGYIIWDGSSRQYGSHDRSGNLDYSYISSGYFNDYLSGASARFESGATAMFVDNGNAYFGISYPENGNAQNPGYLTVGYNGHIDVLNGGSIRFLGGTDSFGSFSAPSLEFSGGASVRFGSQTAVCFDPDTSVYFDGSNYSASTHVLFHGTYSVASFELGARLNITGGSIVEYSDGEAHFTGEGAGAVFYNGSHLLMSSGTEISFESGGYIDLNGESLYVGKSNNTGGNIVFNASGHAVFNQGSEARFGAYSRTVFNWGSEAEFNCGCSVNLHSTNVICDNGSVIAMNSSTLVMNCGASIRFDSAAGANFGNGANAYFETGSTATFMCGAAAAFGSGGGATFNSGSLLDITSGGELRISGYKIVVTDGILNAIPLN